MFLYLLKCPKVHTICIFCILCILFPGIDCVYGKLYYTYMHWYSCLIFGAPFPPTEHDSRIIDKVGWKPNTVRLFWFLLGVITVTSSFNCTLGGVRFRCRLCAEGEGLSCVSVGSRIQ